MIPGRLELAQWTGDARRRTLEIYADLDERQYQVPYLRIINPPAWELGHVAWFTELWVLREALGRAPLHASGDALWNSALVPHADRWSLPLPSRSGTRQYLEEVGARVLEALEAGAEVERLAYFTLLAVFHEDMHTEAFAYTRQTLGYPAPRVTPAGSGQDCGGEPAAGALPGDAHIPGGGFWLGADPAATRFVFDNEKWAHRHQVRPFSIARAPVTQAELAAFVDDGGYRRRDLWTDEGWTWRLGVGAEHPVHWRPVGGRWERRVWDRWVPLEPHRPVIHVSAHEADAFCAWAGRRLPTELEWEVAASGEPDPGGQRLSPRKRLHPWGDDEPTSAHAHLDLRHTDTVDVAAFARGDSAFGCRQMWGNVWEWTSSPFGPYPGFVADPYKEYSEPWFGTHRVLRGGCFVTRARLLRNTWRNFYPPDRRDVWAGFRTCAL